MKSGGVGGAMKKDMNEEKTNKKIKCVYNVQACASCWQDDSDRENGKATSNKIVMTMIYESLLDACVRTLVRVRNQSPPPIPPSPSPPRPEDLN